MWESDWQAEVNKPADAKGGADMKVAEGASPSESKPAGAQNTDVAYHHPLLLQVFTNLNFCLFRRHLH